MKIEGRKKHWRRRISIFVAVGLLAGAAYILGWSNTFTVKQISVLGAPSVSETQLIQSSIRIGQRLARLEPKNLQATLSSFPWLDRSSIKRNWFSGVVTIHVWTRTPLAVTDRKLIDREGKLFVLPGQSGQGLPEIVASSSASRVFAVKLIVNFPQQLRHSLLTVTSSGVHFARVEVREKSLNPPRKITIIWGDLSNGDLKARVYYSLIALPENRKISLVDVSAPHAPIVK